MAAGGKAAFEGMPGAADARMARRRLGQGSGYGVPVCTDGAKNNQP